MKNKIIKYINELDKEFFCINDIVNTLNIDKEIIEEILFDLQLESTIYKISNGKYTKMPSNYYVGQLQTSKNGQSYVSVKNNKRLYIDIEDLNEAINFDTIVVELIEDENKHQKGIVKSILKRENNRVVCEVINTHKTCNLKIFNINFNGNLTLSREEMKTLVPGDRIIVKLEIQKQPVFIEKIGHKDDPDCDIECIAISRDIDIKFSDDAIKESESLPKEVLKSDFIGRLDLTSKNIFTIDGINTKDIDDAISIELLPNGNYLLGVHISDVSHYIKRGMYLYNEAQQRGNSVYLLDYVIPMFPHLISNGICSLNENVDRLTKSCIMEIDNKGNIVNYNITKSVINSKKKMNYDEVNKILEENIIPKGYEKFTNDLYLMQKLSNILTNKRAKQGSLEFCSNELSVEMDEFGNVTKFNTEVSRTAEKLIENFMIAANETVASNIYWINLPFVYRIHEAPEEERIKEAIDFIKQIGFRIKNIENVKDPRLLQRILNQLSNSEEFPITSNILLKSMKRARYDTNNLGHFGLSSQAYTHFTSPIRRFSDLLVHTLLEKYENLSNDEDLMKYFENLECYLKDCCKHISYKERQASIAENDANKFKMLEYMENFINDEIEATITMIDSREIQIKTKDNITGKIYIEDVLGDSYFYNDKNKRIIGKESKIQYKIGNKIIVKVKEICKHHNEIYFYLIKNISKEYEQNFENKQLVKTYKKEK